MKFNSAKLRDAGALVLASASGLAGAQTSTDPATAGAAAVQTLVTGQAGYLPIMIALAIASVGIMIAVKWVKRAKGAA